ncbi:thiol-disulfide oxidoreductase [Chryseomicrobium excrementi]|uniref:Thiol-disulfide oxidoreductase n=1 Tax=Chryseomicrobium excrementi TaxID=2041346 RepID=A0A2M9EZD5_9BACL|nr:thiol-disulfide oxidoreductase ResA [Chryseomicrobium excrementi]PJK16564.1 thiol-disulfide oxidoreductase [Chryseomicrobium excrementi]
MKGNKKKKRLIFRVCLLSLFAGVITFTIYSSVTSDSRSLISEGDRAPDFVLTDLEGKSHRLSDYKGQGVFLNFWGTWCKPCEKEMPYIENQYNEFKDHGVQTIAVNVGEPEFKVKSFVNQYDMSFPVVIDTTKDVQDSYTIGPLPTTLLINPEGEVIKVITGEMTEEDIKTYMQMIQPTDNQ